MVHYTTVVHVHAPFIGHRGYKKTGVNKHTYIYVTCMMISEVGRGIMGVVSEQSRSKMYQVLVTRT